MRYLKLIFLVATLFVLQNGICLPKIILKLDDFKANNNNCNGIQVLTFLKSKNVKTGFGAIANGYDATAKNLLLPYLNAVNERGEKLFEIWNHGYDHSNTEFKGTTYEFQKTNFLKADSIIKALLGVQMHTFGAPYNANDANSMEVFKLKSEYTTLYFSNISPAVGSGLTNLSNRVNLETTTGMPDSAYFVTNLAPVRNTYTDYVVLQAHPPYFTAASFEQFKKVINYLTTQGYEFVLPYDYVRGKTQKAPTGLNAVSTGDGKVQLSWADNSPNEDMYQIEQSTDGTNWTFVGSASANATNYTISLPQTGDRYYFRVCASCGVKSGYTNIVEFVRTGIFNPNSKQSCIKVFPNPCNDIINIDLSLKENQNVNLELKNTAGKTLKTLFSGYLFPFQQPVSLDVSDVTKGVYFLVLTDSKGISDIQTLLIN